MQQLVHDAMMFVCQSEIEKIDQNEIAENIII